MTPLHATYAAGHDEVAHLLLDNGASFDSVAGGTPLMNACAAGHGECVRVLLKAGADPLKDVLVPDARRDQKGLRTTDNAYLCAFHSGHREVEGIQARETAVGCRARLRQAPMSETVDEPSPQSRRGQPPHARSCRENAGVQPHLHQEDR